MNKKEKDVIGFLIGITIIAILIIVILTFLNREYLSQEFSEQILIYGTPALFFVTFILETIPQVISPIFALGAGISTGMNPYLAIGSTVLGSSLGSILAFALGKRYMYGAVDILTSKESAKKLTKLTNKYGKLIIPIAAISPLPYLSVVIGTLNFSGKNFITYGLIPRAIGIIGYGLLFTLF